MKTSEKIIVTTAHYECPMCPTIVSGITEEGWTVYARYRWGRLSIRIDRRESAPHGGAEGVWIFDEAIGDDPYAGWMDYEELRKITAEMIDWPDELTPKTCEASDASAI